MSNNSSDSYSESKLSESIQEQPKSKRQRLNPEDSFTQAQQLLNKSNDLLRLFQAYLTLLLGRALEKEDQQELNLSWGVPYSQNEENLLPDCIMKFPNPDSPLLMEYQIQSISEGLDQIQKIFKLNLNSKTDLIFMKAIEQVYMHLSPHKQYQWFNTKGILKPIDENYILSSDKEEKNITLLKQNDVLQNIVSQMQNRLIGSQRIIKLKWQEAFDLDFKNLRKMKPKAMQKGNYFDYKNGKWHRTQNDTADFLTLMRQIVIVMLSKAGFGVTSFISQDGQHIYLNLYTIEENLKAIAQKHKLLKKLNFWFTDLFSLEPVDKNYRLLRLNNRLWKPDDYEVSQLFTYFRPMIIDLLKQINFKKVSREVNLNRLNEQNFRYGEKDINDDEDGPTDQEWFAYYQYLVHLQKEIASVREDYLIENDVATLINKQLKPTELYLIRNKHNPICKKLNKNNIREKENRFHQLEIKKYTQKILEHLNDYKNLSQNQLAPCTKQIKILKQEKLGHKYYNIFKEALQVANTNTNQNKVLLKNLWEATQIEQFETFTIFTNPNHSISPALQGKHLACWKKYQINENNKISFFPTTERLKLANLQICDSFSLNDLLGYKLMTQLFCLHDHYELFGHCKYHFEPLSLDEQFYQKKLYHLEYKWQFKCRSPWQTPYDEICQYFGEKIGLYFYYSSYFTEQLTTIALVGLAANIIEWLIGDPKAQLYQLMLIIFPFIQIQWTSFFTDYWKQKQIIFNMKNGQNEKNQIVVQRSNFQGLHKRSVENDYMNSLSIEEKEFYLRVILSGLILMILIGIYGGIIVGLFMMTITLKEILIGQWAGASVFNLEVVITATINIIIITFLDRVYEEVSKKLTDFENQRTVTDYENSFVLKKYILYFASYVGPLVILNFLNSIFGLYCSVDNCQAHIKDHFSTIIVWIFFFKLAKIILILYNLNKIPIFKYTDQKESVEQFIEEQSNRQNYAKTPERYGTMEDYMEVFLLNTLLSLFGYCFPFSFMLVWIQNIAQLRADKAKFLYLLQRPWPQNVASLGVWNPILEFINYACILTNTGQMTVTYNNIFQYELILVYLSFMIFNFCMKFVIGGVFGETPYSFLLMVARQKYLLKCTIEQFSKNKSSSNQKQEQVLKRFPIPKLFGTKLSCTTGLLETISSQSDLEDHFVYESKSTKQSKKTKISKTLKAITAKIKQQQFAEPSKEILQMNSSSRPYNWAFEVKTWVRSNPEKLFKGQKLLNKLQLLEEHKILWTDLRISQRSLYLRRKQLTLKSLDARKLTIFVQNIEKMKQFYTKQAEIKYNKQFKMVDANSKKLDEIREYQQLVDKRNTYIKKHTWISSRRIVVLKIKGVWFSQFRKKSIKYPSIKVAKDQYQQSQAVNKAQKSNNLLGKFDKMVEGQKTAQFTLEDFYQTLAKLDFQSTKDEFQIPLDNTKLNHYYYHISSRKSNHFKNLFDQFKDTYIFDNQTQMIQQFLMQYFEEELFPIPYYTLHKQYSETIWQATNTKGEECILQFIQIKHGESLQFQPKSKANLGVSYLEYTHYIRQTNLIDQIDDFYIKGYCALEYKVEPTYTLKSVIRYRSMYSLFYMNEELMQFLYANLILLKERTHGELSSSTYFLVGSEYVLCKSTKQESDLFQLAKIILEMILLKQINDPIPEFQDLKPNPLKQYLYEMLFENPSIDELLSTMAVQNKFIEMVIEQPSQQKQIFILDEFIQLMIHRINFSVRMKHYEMGLKYIEQFQTQLLISFFQKDKKEQFQDVVYSFLTQQFESIITKSTYLQFIYNIIFVTYFKSVCLLQLFDVKVTESISQLQGLIQICTSKIDLLLQELSLNLKMESVTINQKNTLLKRRNSTSYEDLRNEEEHQKILVFLRKNQQQLKLLQKYNTKLKRIDLQLRTLLAINCYFKDELNIGQLLIADIIQDEIQLITKVRLTVDSENVKDLSPSQINFNQTSPLEQEQPPQVVEQTEEFNILNYIENNFNYCNQLLYLQYLQFILWHDAKNELFQRNIQSFLKLTVSSATFEFIKSSLQVLYEFQIPEEYMKTLYQCQIGKYMNIKFNKWLEQTYWQMSDLIYSDDLQFLSSQIMRYSKLKQTMENRNILLKIIAIEGETTALAIMKIRASHQLLHMGDYQPFPINSQTIDSTALDEALEIESLINNMQKMHGMLNLSSISFRSQGMKKFYLYHQLSICYCFSIKHFQNIIKQKSSNNFKFEQAKRAINEVGSNIEYYVQIMKKAQILRLNEQRLLIDERQSRFDQYACLSSFFYICQHRSYSILEYYEKIKEYLDDESDNSIILISMIQYYYQTQQFDIMEILIVFSKQLCTMGATIFLNSYEELQHDLSIYEALMRRNYQIIYPLDILYVRRNNYDLENSNLQMRFSILLYQQLYTLQPNDTLEYLMEFLPTVQDKPELKKFIDICKVFILLLKCQMGDIDTELLTNISEFKYEPNTLIYTIIQHFLAQFYILMKDYEQAYQSSLYVLNFLYSLDVDDYIVLKLFKFKSTFSYNKTKITQIDQLTKFKIKQDDEDPALIHLIDKTFKNQAMLNHLDIRTNLQIDLPQISLLNDFIQLVDTEFQLAQVFKIIGQSCLLRANEEGLEILRLQILNDYQQNLKYVHKQQKKLKKQQMNQILLKKYTQENSNHFNYQMNIFNYLEKFYESIAAGINIRLIINWTITASEKAISIFRSLMFPFKKQSHYYIPDIYLVLHESYMLLNNTVMVKQCLTNSENELLKVYDKRKTPQLGYYFYKQAQYKMWFFKIQEQFLENLSQTFFTSHAIRLILILLLQQNPRMYQIIDSHYINEDVEIFQNQLIELFEDKRNIEQYLGQIQATNLVINQIFKDLCSQMCAYDQNGFSSLQNAYAIFSFFNQKHSFFNSCSEQLAQQQLM